MSDLNARTAHLLTTARHPPRDYRGRGGVLEIARRRTQLPEEFALDTCVGNRDRRISADVLFGTVARAIDIG